MEGKRFIQKIKLTNFLSFGPEGMELELEPLNVLIGPNASGKSNFMEAFGLLQALPRDLTAFLRQGGGSAEWAWKGTPRPEPITVKVVAERLTAPCIEHELTFATSDRGAEITGEEISILPAGPSVPAYRFREGEAVIWGWSGFAPKEGCGPIEWIGGALGVPLSRDDLSVQQSVLSQFKHPVLYPAVTYLGQQFGRIMLYRDWRTGPRAGVKLAQMTDEPPDYLEEDGRNLFLVLNNLEQRLPAGAISDRARRLHELAERMTFSIFGNTVLLYLHERGLQSPVPASRLSDGTLRYLCLLAILLHPEPPPLICIEEPELGLHPDIIPAVAELLIDASQRTQLVVTTHSDFLVSALSDVPESVVVCERDDGGTRLQRLDPAPLKEWLETYRLGDLWVRGDLGGTRW